MTERPTDLFALGVEAYRGGDYSKALILLEKAARASSNHAETHHLLAVVLVRESRFDEARDHFLVAIRNAPERYDFCCNYALFLHDSGDTEQSAALFSQVIQVRSDFAPALNGLGNALFKLGDFAGAERALRQAIVVQPGNALHHNNLGNVLKACGNTDEAVSCYRKALAFNPDCADAHFNLGVALKEQGQQEGAKASFLNALRIRPDYDQAHAHLEQVANFWSEPLVGRWVVLRRYGEQHAQFLHATFRDSAFMAQYNRMIPSAEPLTKIVAALRKSERSLPWSNLSVDWVIHGKDAKGVEHPIGLANLAALDLQNRRAEYLLGIVNQHGHHARFALEASLLVMEFAFNRARLNKITSVVYEGNPEAQSLTLQLGFTQEGFRPRHMRVVGEGYLGLYENGMHIEDFRANQRLATLSRRWLGRDVTREGVEALRDEEPRHE